MNIKKTIIALLITTLTYGQECEKEKQLMECVNEAINKTAAESYGKNPFDSYTFFKEIEKKLLTNVNKEEYQKLFLSLIKKEKRKHRKQYRELKKLCDDVGFDFNLYSVSSSILTKCPYEVFFTKNQTTHKFMYKHILLLNKLEANGYNDINLLNSLINNIDEDSFSKIVYRAPIILLAIINLDLKYNPHLKNYKKGDNNPFMQENL